MQIKYSSNSGSTSLVESKHYFFLMLEHLYNLGEEKLIIMHLIGNINTSNYKMKCSLIMCIHTTVQTESRTVATFAYCVGVVFTSLPHYVFLPSVGSFFLYSRPVCFLMKDLSYISWNFYRKNNPFIICIPFSYTVIYCTDYAN